jgi:hypothetical protein
MRLLHRNGWAKFICAIGLVACGIGPLALLTLGDVRVGREPARAPRLRRIINFVVGCALVGAGALLIVAHLTSGVAVVPLVFLMGALLGFGGALCLLTAVTHR